MQPLGLSLWLRSLAFALGLSASTVAFALVLLGMAPCRPLRRYAVARSWCRLNLWWLARTCRLTHRVEGLEHIPSEPAIVLCKHQSAWETLALNLLFHPQVWVLKRELLRLPFFGWGIGLLKPIAIDRGAGRSAVEQVIDQGRDRLRAGYWVVVFPEGTRVPPGERRRYKIGGAKLAETAGVPVIPIAHDAGHYWPRNSFIKRPGIIRLRIGPPVETRGLSAAEINRITEHWIEEAVSDMRERHHAGVRFPCAGRAGSTSDRVEG